MAKAKTQGVTRGPALVAAALVAALAMSLLAGGVASAHAQYVCSDPQQNAILPQPPSAVSVCLSEEVAPGSGQIRVTDGAGGRIDTNGTSLSPADARVIETSLSPSGPGIYTVTWSATSGVDGHFTAGSFFYRVQDVNGSVPALPEGLPASVNPPVSPLEVALRFASYATLAGAVGAVGLAALALEPARRKAVAPSAAPPATGALRLLLLWAAGQAGAFAAFTAAWAGFTLVNSPSSAPSPFALSLIERASVGGALALLVALTPRATGNFDARSRLRALLLAGLLLSSLAVALTALSSHSAAAIAWRPWGALIDFAHLGAVTFWVGAVMGLVLLRSQLSAPEAVPFARAVLERFARLAFLAVGAVLSAGVLLALIQVGSIDRLFSTFYGALVLAKVSLFVPMVALGTHNHYRSIPRLEGPAGDAAAALLRIARNVRAEALLAVCVLAVASLLTALSPAAPVEPALLPFTLTQTSGEVNLTLQAYPAPSVPGNYTITLTLWNATTGAELDGTTNANLTFTLVNSTLPPQAVALQGPHGNHYYTSPDQILGAPGTWRVDVDVVWPAHLDLLATFNLPIHKP